MATQTTASVTFLQRDYYEKNALEMVKTKLVYAKYGQKKSIPAGNGTTIIFDKFDEFDPDEAMTPLTEGVTPDPLDFDGSQIEVSVAEYGRHVVVSNRLKKSSPHDVMQWATDLLGEVMGIVVERVTRNATLLGTNVQYANGRTSRLTLTSGDKLTTTEIRKAVRTLKKANAKMFDTSEDGKSRKPHFVCICSPDATYDLQSDSLWQDVSKYSNAEQIYEGELGRLFGVVFVESNQTKVYTQSVLTAVAAHTDTSATITVDEITDKAAAYLVAGALIKIGTTEYTVASCNQAAKTITLSAGVTPAIDADTLVYSEDAGALDATTKAGLNVSASTIFGRDAYGVVDIDGEGTLKTIVHGFGSAGTADPLDQRATVGVTIPSYAAILLQNSWLVRIEHAVSA